MFRRTSLALALVATLGFGGLGIANTAEAGHGCHRGGYYSGHHGHGGHGGYGYGPRVSYYGGYGGYYAPAYYQPYYPAYYNRGSGVYFSIGF